MARDASHAIPFCAYADPLVARLKRLAPTAVEGSDVDAVHDARVAARRLKAGLDLIEPLLDDDDVAGLQKTLRRLRRRLGKVRDADVMLGHLRQLSRNRRLVAATNWLAERLSAQRQAALKRMRKKTAAQQWIDRLGPWREVRTKIAGLGDAVDRAMRASLDAQSAAFCGQADRMCAQMLDSLFDQERDPHQLRIAGKQLRYTLEMLARMGQRPPEETRRLFKRVQDALGLWHDYVVLTDHVMRESVDSELAHRDPGLQAQALALAGLTLRRSERYLRHFADLWRAHREALASLDVSGR